MGQFVLGRHPRTGAALAERRVDGLVVGDRRLRRVALARLRRTLARAVAQGGGAPPRLPPPPPEPPAPAPRPAPAPASPPLEAPPGPWFEADTGQPAASPTPGPAPAR